MRAVILAGGRGTRIAEYYPDLPKPMIPVEGKPLVQHQVELLAAQGFKNITLTVGYSAGMIQNYFGDGSAFGVKISYIQEEEPLGTGGALALLPREDILLLNGDLYAEADLAAFAAFHRERGADITLFAHPNSHPADSDLIITGRDERVIGWADKNQPREYPLRNLVNGGIYILSEKTLPHPDVNGKPPKLDVDREIVRPRIEKERVFAYRSSEYLKDMGTPERLRGLLVDIKKGVPAARVRFLAQRAVFLDRDGTLNKFKGLITEPDEIKLLPGAAAALARINGSAYLALCVTNQPVIARGDVEFKELEAIHGQLDTLLAEEAGAYLDDLLFCPHHPDGGYPGERPEYKGPCGCRKPTPGLLLEAARRYNVDLSASWMVGDTTLDVAAGRAAGCKTIGLATGKGMQDGNCDAVPDYFAADMAEAVDIILGQKK